MILLADSGSTKTSWALLEEESLKQTNVTPGLNPYFHQSDSVEAVLKADLLPNLFPDHIKEIHFYGAGCSTEKNNAMIRDALRQFFHHADVSVYHDILGAGRALFGRSPGLSCILGTGCNCCYYDGENVHTRVDSLGYLFGDEGAGSNLGKRLMEHYLKRRLPPDLRQQFDETYRMKLEEILNALYNRPYPNRFLASFSHFIGPRKEHPFLQNMIKESFHDFFEAQVFHYPEYKKLPVGFVGSVAYHYREILEEVAEKEGVMMGLILENPLGGLVRYHLKN